MVIPKIFENEMHSLNNLAFYLFSFYLNHIDINHEMEREREKGREIEIYWKYP